METFVSIYKENVHILFFLSNGCNNNILMVLIFHSFKDLNQTLEDFWEVL
ncbi:hypothetical protein Bca4012_020707 [Brassica carinata]